MNNSSALTSERSKARNSVFRLLKFRPRSEYEIRAKLKLKKFDEETINDTVDYFQKVQLIDDRQFARSWVNARLLRPFGLNRIRFELKNKGIDDEIIKEELNAVRESFSEYDAVLKVARQRITKYKNIDPMKAKKRTFDYLVRRGFSTSTILKALKNL